MKKTELVHVHALLTCVAEDLLARGAVEPEAFAEYRSHGVSSRELRASRTEHETAVRLLGDLLSTAVEGESDGASREADASENGHTRSRC